VKALDAASAVRRDPLMIDTGLHLRETFYPLGFRLRIATNSPDVLEAAGTAWSHYREQLRPCDGIALRVMVAQDGELCGPTTHRAQGHLYSVVSDRDNVASLDLESLEGSIFVSARTAADHPRLLWYFVESLAYMLLAQRYVVPVHAACVARRGRGVLLCGRTEAGKSTLAYACARAGWSYLSDDAVFLLPEGAGRLALGPHRQFRFRPDAPRLFPELERFRAGTRPNGKVSIEVPVSEFPGIKAREHARIENVVLLERSADAKAMLEPASMDEALGRMLDDMPSYGPEVNAMHERALHGLESAPVSRLRYSDLAGAVASLERLA
jgi:hypothetical protein